MLSNIIIRSAAAFGGAPFRLVKCTALGSAGAGAAGGAAVGDKFYMNQSQQSSMTKSCTYL